MPIWFVSNDQNIDLP